MVCPLGENPLDLGIGHLGDPTCPRGQTYQSCTTVTGVGNAFHVARRLELLDQEGRTLLGDTGLLCKVGDPGPVRTDPGSHASLGQSDIGDARSHEGIVRTPLELPIGDEEQDAELLPLTRVGHRAILDR